jgi:hypothetical protein
MGGVMMGACGVGFERKLGLDLSEHRNVVRWLTFYVFIQIPHAKVIRAQHFFSGWNIGLSAGPIWAKGGVGFGCKIGAVSGESPGTNLKSRLQ